MRADFKRRHAKRTPKHPFPEKITQAASLPPLCPRAWKASWKAKSERTISLSLCPLARIDDAVLKTRMPYDETRIAGNPEQQALKRRLRLEKQAAKLGFALSPLPT